MALDAVSPLGVRVSAALVFAVLFVWFTIGLVFEDLTVRDVLDLGSAKASFYLFLSSFPSFHHIATTFFSYLSSTYTVLCSLSPYDTFLCHYTFDILALTPLHAILDVCLPSADTNLRTMGDGPLFPQHHPFKRSIATHTDLAIQFSVRSRNSTSPFTSSILKNPTPSPWCFLFICFTVAVCVSISMLLLLRTPLDYDDLRTVSPIHKKLALLWTKLESMRMKLLEDFDEITGITTLAVFASTHSLQLLDRAFLDLCDTRNNQHSFLHDLRFTSYFSTSSPHYLYCTERRTDWIYELSVELFSPDLRWLLFRSLVVLCAAGSVLYSMLLMYDIWVAFFARPTIPFACLLERDESPVKQILVRPFKAPLHSFPPRYTLLPEFTSQYKLGEVLGSGAYASVHIARRLSDDQQVAVKFIKIADDGTWSRHRKWGLVPRDVIFMDKVEHENIIKLIDVFRDDTYIYVVQELFGHVWLARDNETDELIPGVGGRSLADLLRQVHKLSPDVALKIFKQLLSAVHYLHKKGMAHCDIKPDNILIDEHYNIRLIDFGASLKGLQKKRDPAKSERMPAWRYCGTKLYMPPETLIQNGDTEATCRPSLGDVWALGVVLYSMVSGIRCPFRNQAMIREGMDSIVRKHGEERTSTAEIEAVLPIVRRCLEVDPLERVTSKELMELC